MLHPPRPGVKVSPAEFCIAEHHQETLVAAIESPIPKRSRSFGPFRWIRMSFVHFSAQNTDPAMGLDSPVTRA